VKKEEEEKEYYKFERRVQQPTAKIEEPKKTTTGNPTPEIPSTGTETGTETETDTRGEKTKSSCTAQYRDPIHWFGLLVPSALRSSQTIFVRAVEENIPEILRLDMELKQAEIDVRRTRKQISKLSNQQVRKTSKVEERGASSSFEA